MRYLATFFCSFLLGMLGYASLIPILGPTPVSAEYWVHEMLVIKREIVKQHDSARKIIIASGSSTLFSIDAQLLTHQLGIPVINLGLMGGLPLIRILDEAARSASPKDIVLLALEPEYYCREEIAGFDEWVLRNAVAWDHAYWTQLSVFEQLAAIRYLGLKFPIEMLTARFYQQFRPAAIQPRLVAMDQIAVLKKFANAPVIADNLYSIFSMSPYGDIKNSDDSTYSGVPRRADQPVKVCAESINKIRDFIAQQKVRGVTVLFLNTPYVNTGDLNLETVDIEFVSFTDALGPTAIFLDDRRSLLFKRDLFLNSELHLNSRGRELRTKQLLAPLGNLIREQ